MGLTARLKLVGYARVSTQDQPLAIQKGTLGQAGAGGSTPQRAAATRRTSPRCQQYGSTERTPPTAAPTRWGLSPACSAACSVAPARPSGVPETRKPSLPS